MYNYIYDKNVMNKAGEMNTNINVYSPYEGFVKGTLFKTLYQPYKNFEPGKLNATTEREKELLCVMMYYAGLHDLGLYLNVYPEDKDALKLRNEYYEKYMVSKKEFEMNNSPIGWDCKYPVEKGFTFATTPFQWEVKR